MKNIIFFGLSALLIINSLSYVESNCTTDCDSDCNSSDCSTGCRTNCQTPCRRRCNKSSDCRSNCDVKEVIEPEPQKTKETIIVPPRDSGSKTSNINDVKNDYDVNINPNITLTNHITNINNISVPINVTSVNVNSIRVSTSDARSTQTNITARGGENCSSKNPTPDCARNQRQIVILPYPQYRSQQIVTPSPQPRVIVQPIVRQPIIVQAPQLPTPPPQRVPIIIPTPVIQPNPVPVQPQPTVVQPVPQYYWFSQQYIRQPQQTIIPQPQQQVLYQTQPQPCGAAGGQCGQYCLNQPCSQNQQIIPVNYPIPTTSCQTGDCASRMLYALTTPLVSNQMSQYRGINPYLSGDSFAQYGAMNTFDWRNGLSQIGSQSSYDSRNGIAQMKVPNTYDSRGGLSQLTNINNGLMGQIPVGVDSYFIPDQFSNYQIQGGNSTQVRKNSL